MRSSGKYQTNADITFESYASGFPSRLAPSVRPGFKKLHPIHPLFSELAKSSPRLGENHAKALRFGTDQHCLMRSLTVDLSKRPSSSVGPTVTNKKENCHAKE